MSKYLGEINLYIGCMFSGKTSEIIKIVRRFKSINKKVMVLNYSEDKRYGDEQIITHDLIGVEAIMINNLEDIFQNKSYKKIYDESDIICINEGQFFKGLVKFCQKSANEYNKMVYVCGLDGDYQQSKFGDILDLIPCSENVVRLSALCKICGKKACFTKRISSSDDQVLIGGQEDYIPVCRYHFNSNDFEKNNLNSDFSNYNLNM